MMGGTRPDVTARGLHRRPPRGILDLPMVQIVRFAGNKSWRLIKSRVAPAMADTETRPRRSLAP
jgi:hypothetical protein